MRNPLSAASLLVLATVYFVTPLTVASATIETVNITGVKTDPGGTFIVTFVSPAGKFVDKTITVGATSTTSTVAADIAAAFNAVEGGGATSNNGKVSLSNLYNQSVALVDGYSKFITFNFDTDNFVAFSGMPAAIVSFEADPLTGDQVLLTDSTINAGFTAGLADVSVPATAGETIADLTSSLGSALSGAGYVTSSSPGEIEIFSNGALDPTEFDFSIQPNVVGSDVGIATNIEAPAVPEPSSVSLLGLGSVIIGLAAMARRGPHTI